MASMFEYPEAKRVRRAELAGSDSSIIDDGDDPAYDEELRAALEAQIAKSLGFGNLDDGLERGATRESGYNASKAKDEVDASRERTASAEPVADDTADDGYMFRLFSTSNPVSKVVLEDEDEELQGEGGLARGRPISYYWVTDVPAARRQEYEFAAVSGDEVVARSTKRSYGLEMPWKVTSITIAKKSKGGVENMTSAEDPSTTKRRRPGKKRRIAIRTKQRTKKAKEEAAAKQNMDKEEHLKEKKKRLNRLKKLRKRAKAKEKKSISGEGGGEGDSGGDQTDSE